MLFVVIGILFGAPILWTVSVGAVREVTRARARDPRTGCQAWVAVAGVRGRLYRCCEPVFAGGRRCRRHEAMTANSPGQVDPDATPIDESQAVGRAVAQARIGVPLAVLVTIGAIAGVVWLVVPGIS